MLLWHDVTFPRVDWGPVSAWGVAAGAWGWGEKGIDLWGPVGDNISGGVVGEVHPYALSARRDSGVVGLVFD